MDFIFIYNCKIPMRKFAFHKYWIGQNIRWGFFHRMEWKIQMNPFGQLSRCWVDMYWDHNHFHVSLTLSALLIKDHTSWCSFPCGPVVKNPSANVGNAGLIPEWGRSYGEGNGNPLQYSCLENPMHRGAWRATVHGVTKELDMT